MNNSENIWNTLNLQNIDPDKLAFIRAFTQKEKPKNLKDAMPFLLANLSIAKKQNIRFTPLEVQLIAEIISQNVSPEEKEQIQKIMSKFMELSSQK